MLQVDPTRLNVTCAPEESKPVVTAPFFPIWRSPPPPRNNRLAASWTHATGRGRGGRARDECDECDASAQLLLVDDGQVNAAAVRRKGL